jgi:hypothetical protein
MNQVMKNRYRVFRRGRGTFYCEDLVTKKQTTLKTRDKDEAYRLVAAKKQNRGGCRETIGYITAKLEERERESFVVLGLIQNRLATRDHRGVPDAQRSQGQHPPPAANSAGDFRD